MKKCLCLLIALTAGISCIAQSKIKTKPEDFGFKEFIIKAPKNVVHFIVSDTNFSIKKPVFIYCQGSLPYALFYQEDSVHTWLQAFPFNYKKFSASYRFVVITKPGIPVFTKTADEHYLYIDPVTRRTPAAFIHNNKFDYYVSSTNEVINFLIRQKWIDPSRVMIGGHSQGAMIVAKVAASNKAITHAVFLSGNPNSRFDEFIRSIQKDEWQGKINSTEARRKIDSTNGQMKYAYQHPEEIFPASGEKYSSITSFYEPILPYLLKIKVPLFVGFGTADVVADNCNLLPFEFARSRKTNLTLKSYSGCDHSFKRTREEKPGLKGPTENLFDSVMQDVFEWIK